MYRILGVIVMMKEFFSRKRVRVHGHPISHSLAEVYFVEFILQRERFKNIVELGTGQGGLTIVLGLNALRTGTRVVMFDIGNTLGGLYNKLRKCMPVIFYNLDVFSDEAEKIISAITKDGRCLLYCDNGDKCREFNTYVPYLKKHDMVIVHDWESEESKKYKYCKEISMRCIEDTVKTYHFTPIYEEMAVKMGGGIYSFIKEN